MDEDRPVRDCVHLQVLTHHAWAVVRLAGIGREGRLERMQGEGRSPCMTIHTAWTAPRCGATTRQGTPYQAPACRGKRRCRMHGGTNPGAARNNQHAVTHGRYTAR